MKLSYSKASLHSRLTLEWQSNFSTNRFEYQKCYSTPCRQDTPNTPQLLIHKKQKEPKDPVTCKKKVKKVICRQVLTDSVSVWIIKLSLLRHVRNCAQPSLYFWRCFLLPCISLIKNRYQTATNDVTLPKKVPTFTSPHDHEMAKLPRRLCV